MAEGLGSRSRSGQASQYKRERQSADAKDLEEGCRMQARHCPCGGQPPGDEE